MAADPNGIFARTFAAIRYAATGTTPATWFGPGLPVKPQAPEETKGRTFDYPTVINIRYQPRASERVSFQKMKALAQNCDPLKMIMGRQRDLVKALEWTVKPKAEQAADAGPDPEAARIGKFLEKPDQRHDWPQWINAILDQLFVYDAVSIYRRPNRGGGLYALEQIDGSTITPLVDAWGRPPLAPDPTYQQILKGVVATQYTDDELLYYPEHFRIDHIYGHSRVEQLITSAETQIALMESQLGHFTHGNVGEGYFTAPQGFNPTQVADIEKAWNAMMDPAAGRRIRDRKQSPFLPDGVEWHATKTDMFDEVFNEWLMRLVCFQFGVSPTPFIKQSGLGHNGAMANKDAAEEAGIAQLMQYIRRLMNRIIADDFQRPDLEFSWVEDREMDPKTAADIDDIRVKNGTRTRNEVRDRNGEPPLPDGDVALIYTSGGAVTIDTILNPPPPPEPLRLGGPAPKDPKVKAEPDTAQPVMQKGATRVGENALTQIVSAFLATKGGEYADKLSEALGLAKADPSEEGYGPRIESAFDDLDWNWTGLAASVEPVLAGVAVAAGTDAVSNLGLFDKATLKAVTERSTAWARERGGDLVGMTWDGSAYVPNPDAKWSISESTRTMLRGQIEAAMEEGQSTRTLAKTIRESTAFSKERADSIARTETATADVQGAIAGWRASGLVGGRQWLVGDDCCDDCQLLEDVIVGIDEEFPDGDAPLHPNCRCSETPVLIDDMPDAE